MMNAVASLFFCRGEGGKIFLGTMNGDGAGVRSVDSD